MTTENQDPKEEALVNAFNALVNAFNALVEAQKGKDLYTFLKDKEMNKAVTGKPLTEAEKLALLERVFSEAFATKSTDEVTFCYHEGIDIVYLLVPDENEAKYLRTLANQS